MILNHMQMDEHEIVAVEVSNPLLWLMQEKEE
jgi:hypothetical protein